VDVFQFVDLLNSLAVVGHGQTPELLKSLWIEKAEGGRTIAEN
jgi:hypothetical protein